MNLRSTEKPSLFLTLPLPPFALHPTAFPCLSLRGRFTFLGCRSTTPSHTSITARITVHCKYVFPILQEAPKWERAILNLLVTAQAPGTASGTQQVSDGLAAGVNSTP